MGNSALREGSISIYHEFFYSGFFYLQCAVQIGACVTVPSVGRLDWVVGGVFACGLSGCGLSTPFSFFASTEENFHFRAKNGP